MEMDMAISLVPVHYELQPVGALEQKGITQYRPPDRQPGRLRFLGVLRNNDNRNYGPSGRELKDPSQTGRIINLYV